jgi:hypothetical protein
LRFDAVGRDRPSGHAVANVDAVGAVPVRFSTTAVAPWGTASATDSVNDSPGPSGPVRPTPVRVSSTRLGGAAPNPAPLPVA